MVITQYLCSSFISTVQGFPPVSPPSSSLSGCWGAGSGVSDSWALAAGPPLPIAKGFCAGFLPGKGFGALRKPEPHKGANFLRLLTTHLWMNMVVLNEYALCGFYWMSSSSPFTLFIAVLCRSESSQAVASFNIVGASAGSYSKNQISLDRMNVWGVGLSFIKRELFSDCCLLVKYLLKL